MSKLIGFSVSILLVSVITGLYVVVIHFINLFNNTTTIGGTNWSGTLSAIESAGGLALMLLGGFILGPEIFTPKIKDKRPLRTATIFSGIIFLISFIIAMYRCGEMGILPTNGICIRTTGDLVCPTVLFRTEYNITDVEDCKFNTFANSVSSWIVSSYSVDWSKRGVYWDRELLYRVYNLSNPDGNIENVDEMITYEDCYYWGCDPVCNERHDYNIFLAWSSLFTSVALFVNLLLFIFMVDNRPMTVRYQTAPIPKEATGSGDEADNEEEPEEEEEEEEDDEDEESEEADSADELLGKSDSFSGSKSWNFKLRM